MTSRAHLVCLLSFLSTLLVAVQLYADSGVVFYTYPENHARAELAEWRSSTTPLRQWLSLNGEWQLKNPDTGELIQTVNVPCSYAGNSAFMFEKKFEVHKGRGEGFRLHLGEINGDVVVLLNGEQIYEAAHSFLPISLLIQRALIVNGENTLQISLKPSPFRTQQMPGWMPLNLPRSNTGIRHLVFLETLPALFLANQTFTPSQQDSLFTLNSSITLNEYPRDGRPYSIEVSLRQADRILAAERVQLDSTGSKSITLPPLSHIVTRNRQDPIRAVISVDSADVQLDIAQQIVGGSSLPTPGSTLDFTTADLHGINYVYQSTEGSSVFDPKLARKDLEDIKARGFNTIRIIMQPLPEPFYRICDELGILVFQDLPFVYVNQHENRLRDQLAAWLDYYRLFESLAQRHPSIQAIGISFYTDEQVTLQKQLLDAFIKLLNDRQLPVYASTIPTPDNNHSAVDFYIVELLERTDLDTFVQDTRRQLGNTPFFLSAYTYPYSYRHSETELTFARRQQAELYRALKDNGAALDVSGHFIYTYANFYLQLPLLQNGFEGEYDVNWLGLVDANRKPLDPTYSGLDSDLNLGIPDRSYRLSEDNASQSFIYILVGIFNLFVFLISYKRYRLFRQNLGYSIRKPHGFFINLQERIIIPYRQSIFLLLGIALNGAIVYSAIAFYYRDNLVFDFILSTIFSNPSAKTFVIETIWNQPQFLVIGTVAIIGVFHLLALVLKIVSIFARTRVLFGQALAATIWAAAPFAFLLVISPFVYSPILLHLDSYLIPLLIVIFFHLWCYMRWINGARVLMDWLYSRTFIFCTLVLVLLIGGLLYLWQIRFQGWDYLQYAYNIYKSLHPNALF